MDEELCVQQINRAACALFNLKQPSDILSCPVVRILNPADYMEAMATGIPVKDKKKYLAEYGKYVSESIVYDKEYRIIFSIMRDITEEEDVYKRQVYKVPGPGPASFFTRNNQFSFHVEGLLSS